MSPEELCIVGIERASKYLFGDEPRSESLHNDILLMKFISLALHRSSRYDQDVGRDGRHF